MRVIAEDPNAKGLLFAGTGNALYYSLDDGGHWTQSARPACRTRRFPGPWCRSRFHDLVVSTYGRGIYILDDITPLEQMPKACGDTSFAPRRAYRLVRGARGVLNYR